jgi:hypothetical protein
MSKARDLANAGTALTTVSATELGYLDGVTSAVQTQINAKQATVSGVNDTEIGYLDGVTSSIQTQLNAKEATLPSQTGNTGKYLTTDGSAKSWGTVSQYALPTQSGNSGKYLTTNGTAESWGTVSAGGMTLLASGNNSNSLNLTSIPGDYVDLVLDLQNFRTTSGYTNTMSLGVNNYTAGLYQNGYEDMREMWYSGSGTFPSYSVRTQRGNSMFIAEISGIQSTHARITIPQYTAPAGQIKQFYWEGFFGTSNQVSYVRGNGRTFQSGIGSIGPITSIQIATIGAFGTYKLYGVK